MSGAGTSGFAVGLSLFAVAELFFCAAGVFTALSLRRGDPHRRVAIAALIVWSLIVSMLVLSFWAH